MPSFNKLNGYDVEDSIAREMIEKLYFNNISEMKLCTSLVSGNVVKTLGYYSVNDGGAATYLIREKQTDDVENGLIHLINEYLVAELIIENEINIKQIGCKCDGLHDDTLSFELALNISKEKGIPLIISGLVKLTESVNINDSIIKGNNYSRATFNHFDIWNDGVIKNYIINKGSNYDDYVNYLKENNYTGIISSASNILEYTKNHGFILENVNLYGDLRTSNQNGIGCDSIPDDEYTTIRFKIDECGFYFLNGNGLDLITLECSEILNSRFFWINNHGISVNNLDNTKDRPADYSNVLNNYFNHIYNSSIYFNNSLRQGMNISGNLFQYQGQYNARSELTFNDGKEVNIPTQMSEVVPGIEVKGSVLKAGNILKNIIIADNTGEQISAFLSVDITQSMNGLTLKNNNIIKSSYTDVSYMYDLNCDIYRADIDHIQSNVNSQYYRIKKICNSLIGTKQILESGGKLLDNYTLGWNNKNFSTLGYATKYKIYGDNQNVEHTLNIPYENLLTDFNINYEATDNVYMPIMFMLSFSSYSPNDNGNSFALFVLNVRNKATKVFKGYSLFGDISITFNDTSMDIVVPAYKSTAIIPIISTSNYTTN